MAPAAAEPLPRAEPIDEETAHVPIFAGLHNVSPDEGALALLRRFGFGSRFGLGRLGSVRALLPFGLRILAVRRSVLLRRRGGSRRRKRFAPPGPQIRPVVVRIVGRAPGDGHRSEKENRSLGPDFVHDRAAVERRHLAVERHDADFARLHGDRGVTGRKALVGEDQVARIVRSDHPVSFGEFDPGSGVQSREEFEYGRAHISPPRPPCRRMRRPAGAPSIRSRRPWRFARSPADSPGRERCRRRPSRCAA